jgi:predicted RNase H-like HicB family nuclease
MAPRYTLDAPGQDRYISRCMNLEGAVSPYRVIVEWDEDARVWVASSEDVPGLATGADTLEDLIEKLKIVIPELLVENGLLPAGTDNVPFTIKAERSELAPVGSYPNRSQRPIRSTASAISAAEPA